MTDDRRKRSVRARSGLRPAADRQPREGTPAAAGKQPPPRVPGPERSKSSAKSRDGRYAQDKDGNEEAAQTLAPERAKRR